MLQGSGPGYIPGSIWVPWSITRPDQRRPRRRGDGWLTRLLHQLQHPHTGLYQRCLAFHFGSGKTHTDR